MAAAVDPAAYGFLDKASLALLSEDVCFSVVTEPHFGAGADAPIFAAGAREFLESGGNMLAECAGTSVPAGLLLALMMEQQSKHTRTADFS